MTEKRFTLIDGIKKGTHSGIWDKQKQNNQRIGDELWIGEVVSMLNEGVMIADENEQLKQKILDEIDLEVAYVNEVYSDGRMSIEQYDGAIICLQELRGKFE